MNNYSSGRFSPETWLPRTAQPQKERIFSRKPQKSTHAKTAIELEEIFLNPEVQEKIKQSSSSDDELARELYRWGYGEQSTQSFRQHITQAGQFKIERAVRTKNELDQAFFHTPQCGLSEAIGFMEMSRNRKIVALDFNSMFASIVASARFPNPSQLQQDKASDLLKRITEQTIDHGIFLCRIKPKAEFRALVAKFAPLFMGNEGRCTAIRLSQNESLTAWLHACEVNALHPYCHIEVQQGIYSKESISHPLASWVPKAFDLKANGTQLQRVIAKEVLTSLHTCCARVSMINTQWLQTHEVEEEFLKRFNSPPFEHPHYGYKMTERITQTGETLQKWRLFRTDNPSNVYCLSSTVYAHARTKLFKLLVAASELDQARVCYFNIDSLHLSVPTEAVDRTLDALQKTHPITAQLGHLKIEAIADAGLWLDAGLYWLFDWRDGAQRLVKHGALHKEPQQAFEMRKSIEVFDPFLGYETPATLHLLKTMSPHKRLRGNQWHRPSPGDVLGGRLAAFHLRAVESTRIIRALLKAKALASAKP